MAVQANSTPLHGTPLGTERQVPEGFQGANGLSAIVPSLGMALAWFYLNLGAIQWLAQAGQELSPFQALMLGVGSLLLVIKALRQPLQGPLSLVPTIRFFPVLLILGCGLGVVAFPWVLNLEQVPVALFLLGTYGWLGLHLSPAAWRRGLAVAAAIAIMVPFSVQFTTGLGFPSRILTAHAVEFLLHHFQIAALSAEDIIVLDTGLAQVDLPCSGLKSLWAGTLFLLAATGLEGRSMGGRWFLVCLTNLGLLIFANILRVFTLVGILHVLNQPTLAEALHRPLGIMAFVTVCAIAWGLLQWVPRHQKTMAPPLPTAQPSSWLRRIAPAGIALSLVALTLLPHPAAIAPQPPIDLAQLSLPSTLQTTPLPLNRYEQDFFANHPGASVQKQHIQFQGLTGDLLLVASSTWQAQHSPELCLISSGFEVSHMEQRQLNPDIVGRWLRLNGDRQSAAYWFQSSQRTTDDYLSRIWSDVTRRESSWVLVSIVFDGSQEYSQANIQSLLASIHNTIHTSLSS